MDMQNFSDFGSILDMPDDPGEQIMPLIGGGSFNDGVIGGKVQTDRYAEIREHVVLWSAIDCSILVMILFGNCLTIAAVQLSRRLRSVVSNLFILSLAISDLLVGLTLPYHLAFYLDASLNKWRMMCILKFFFNIVACCVSIWSLIAIAVDRYIAIVYPLHYSRWITRRVAVTVIIVGWVIGAIIGAIPLFWNNLDSSNECEFDEVLPPWYMAGIVTPVFSLVWCCMLLLYFRIFREAHKHAKQLRASITGLHDGGHSDWKSVQVVILILGCFTVCWMPYFIVACSQIFKFYEHGSPTVYKAAFSLAMANSGMNPIIYAWKNRNFRRAFSHLLRCKAPDSHALIDDDNARQNMKRKSSSLPPSLSVPPPTPNTPLSAISNESHRPSLTRYPNTAFPLPPPPPSPQSPLQQPIASEPMASFVTEYYLPHGQKNVSQAQSSEQRFTSTKCCLKVVDMAGNGTKGNYILDDCKCTNDLENNNDDTNNIGSIRINHPRIVINDDLSKNNYKVFNNNSCNDLFLSKFKNNNSPSESIVSAPMTPTGNLIVNILENLEAQQMNQDHRNNLSACTMKNSMKCIQLIPSTVVTAVTTVTIPPGVDSMVSINRAIPGTMLCSSNSLRNANSIFCNRNAKSRSAPQQINCWSD